MPSGSRCNNATAKIGAILVCINPAYRTHEHQYVLGQAGVRPLVAARSYRTSDYAALIDEVRPACPGLEHVVLTDSPEWQALPDRGGDPAVLAEAQMALDPHDPINIQYTSGTTGLWGARTPLRVLTRNFRLHVRAR